MTNKQKGWLVAGIILLVLALDQWLKFYVKLNFRLGESRAIFSWFELCFVENNGMAFGMSFLPKWFLTAFRIVVSGFLFYYLYSLVRRQAEIGFLVLVALVTAGALGNIIDCLFYGVLFSASTPLELATWLPADGGYECFGLGRVVDMLYFPLLTDSAGETIFFRPVFNLADSAITTAVIAIILFYRESFNQSFEHTESK